MPPATENAKAIKPPTMIPKVLGDKNTSAVIVAPTVSPKKIVAVFIIGPLAASASRLVDVPTSFTRLPNNNIPSNGTDDGTKIATTVPSTIGNDFHRFQILISCFDGNFLSISRILIEKSFLLISKLATSGIMTGTSAIYE